MKKFVLGFIAGGIICSALTGFAVEYVVNVNPYPVKVNGAETTIEGYNINDSSYFKLRDIADAVGGFDVGFENNTIVLTTDANKPEPTDAPTPLPTATTSEPLPDVETEIIDGVEYVYKRDIEKMLESIGLGDYEFSATMFYDKTRHDGVVLLENIPYSENSNQYIPLDYYISTIIPVINSLR